MLSKDQIKKNLKQDPFWEPDPDATGSEWKLYEEVLSELEEETYSPDKEKTAKEKYENELDEDDLEYPFGEEDEMDELDPDPLEDEEY